MTITHKIGSGKPLFSIPDFRDFAADGAPSLLDCGGDLVLGTGCDKCSFCREQASNLSRAGHPAIPQSAR